MSNSSEVLHKNPIVKIGDKVRLMSYIYGYSVGPGGSICVVNRIDPIQGPHITILDGSGKGQSGFITRWTYKLIDPD
jgi:hypothetical protein